MIIIRVCLFGATCHVTEKRKKNVTSRNGGHQLVSSDTNKIHTDTAKHDIQLPDDLTFLGFVIRMMLHALHFLITLC